MIEILLLNKDRGVEVSEQTHYKAKKTIRPHSSNNMKAVLKKTQMRIKRTSQVMRVNRVLSKNLKILDIKDLETED